MVLYFLLVRKNHKYESTHNICIPVFNAHEA